MTAGKTITGVVALMRSLLGARCGNVLPLAAGAMIVAAALVGGAVDMGRAYVVKSRLQAACDAATLAGRRATTTNGYDSTAQTEASAYFNTNFDAGQFGARNPSFSTSSVESGNTVLGTASATVDTTVMRIFGSREFVLTANCRASMGVGNSDVMLVLDTTGSMDWTLSGSTQTRIQALRTAMKNFYTTLAAATAGSNARIRYGFVPYSSSVNVGQLLLTRDATFLADTVTIQSREAQYRQESVSTFDHWGPQVASSGNTTTNVTYDPVATQYSGPYSGWTASWDCQNAEPGDTAWTNNGSATTTGPTTTVNGSGQQVTTTTVSQPQVSTRYFCQRAYWGGPYYVYSQRQYRNLESNSYLTADPVNTTTTTNVFDHWDYKPVSYNTSLYKTFVAVSTNTGSSGAAQSSTWEGCIEERSSSASASFSYNSITGISPGAADLDIDSAPTASAGSKWSPMWPEQAYYRTNSSGYLTNTYPTTRGGKADYACPRAARLLATMTQSEFDAYADSLTPDGSTYHDIGMVWGARLASPDGIFSANVNVAPPNGGNVSRHIVFMTDGEMSTSYSTQTSWGIEYHDRRVTDDGYTDNDNRHTSRFLALCAAAKAKGIRVWAIAFAAGTSTDLTTCASPSSAFTVSNATQLNAAFQEIAKQVGELRVVQ